MELKVDIKILKTPYSLDVFLSFVDITLGDSPKFNMYKIAINGTIDFDPKKTMEFNSFADRITFFNQLEEIKFNY